MSEDYKAPKIFDLSHRNFEIKLHNWIFLVKYFNKVRKRSVFFARNVGMGGKKGDEKLKPDV